MKKSELMHYLMHFDNDTEVVFLDDSGYIHGITDDSRDTYLGNSNWDKAPKHIRLQSTGIKHKLER